MQVMAFLIALGLVGASPAKNDAPKVIDTRLTLELFAEHPAIVTPTGIAVDNNGRVIVIECNTHFRPEDYKGPTSDRIRIFEDTDHDGKADRISTFFEGTKWTMGLGLARDGSLYVATRALVFRLRDTNRDGKADENTPIARLETAGAYPHNGLSGVNFDHAGNVYIGLGENLGEPYKLIGSDGSSIAGGGEGGSIFRCRPDGSKLERVATGFWNPFQMSFDAFGRLFAVDNDPDSRPPCRLLHIIENGDYGYRFRYGRKGVHPFIAWDGELPGTLPMMAGTGEAPSGVLTYESDNLPADYRGDLLATSWGDHRIDRFRPRERGASFRSAAEPIVTGGEDFRPVGIATAPDGSIYISDWVNKSYPVHGQGRIWRLRSKATPTRSSQDSNNIAHPDRRIRESLADKMALSDAGRVQLLQALKTHPEARARAVALETLVTANQAHEELAFAQEDLDPLIRAMAVRLLKNSSLNIDKASKDSDLLVQAEALRKLSSAKSIPTLRDAIATGDPYLSLAAREGVRKSLDSEAFKSLTTDPLPAVRLASLLLLRQSDQKSAQAFISKFLSDPDPSIRFAAIQWVAEEGLESHRKELEKAVTVGAVSRLLFEGYLAALERLDGVKNPDLKSSGQDRVSALVSDSKTSSDLLVRALRVLRPDDATLTSKRFESLLKSTESVKLEAIRSLRESPIANRSSMLKTLASDTRLKPILRTEAIVGLESNRPEDRMLLIALSKSDQASIRREALRSLRGKPLNQAEEVQIKSALLNDAASLELLRTLNSAERHLPINKGEALDTWIKLSEGPADPSEGERIFFHPKGPGCYRCHEIDGRGGRIGPELSATGRTLDRKRLIESIINPSKEVAPAFVPWLIAKTDGTIKTGLLIGETIDGKQTYSDSSGSLFTISPTEVSDRKPQPTSIMPDGLSKLMTVQEFRDLLAYLQAR
jgi:putative membrane-bound dehydrogenase-like protein